jgi:hypothetical protein
MFSALHPGQKIALTSVVSGLFLDDLPHQMQNSAFSMPLLPQM